MDDERLTHLLNKQAERAIPASLDLRPAIHRRLQMKKSPQPRLRLARAAFITILLLTLATAVYAFYQSALRLDPGIRAAHADNQIVTINLTQPVNPLPRDFQSLNITLDYAYADGNRIAVGYHVSGQAKASDDIQLFTNPTLTDNSGHRFYWIPASGEQAAANPSNDADAITPFRTNGVMSFDSAILQSAPSALSLSLRLEVAYTTAAQRAANPAGMMPAGESTFEFSVPFNPGQSLSVNQSAAGEFALELKKVVISPSLTRLEICAPAGVFASTSEHWLEWNASINLTVNGQLVTTSDVSFAGSEGQPVVREDGCRALVIPDKLTGHNGEWALTVGAFSNIGDGERLQGPWTFNFTVNP